MKNKIGIIGGSGLYEFEGLTDVEEIRIETPFGSPSDNFITGKFEGNEVVFLSRFGRGHKYSPSEVNYRANIYGLKLLNVNSLICVSPCGSLKEKIKPKDFVIPDQFVDLTRDRKSTFFTDGIVAHVSFANPVSDELAKVLIRSAKEVGVAVHEKGTYVNIEGPQFSTKAESNLYRSWGMDIIGMTNATEAKLAREAEISFASLISITDYDCWYERHEAVTVEMVIENLKSNISNAKRILEVAIPKIADLEISESSLSEAIITDLKAVSEECKDRLSLLIGKYLEAIL